MNAKHTPGPWIVGHDRKNPIVEAAALEDADGIWVNGGYIIGRFAGADARENAALVAAAPDLLAALQDMVDLFRTMHPDLMGNPFFIHSRAAIAKAEAAA